jgi:hypothetical protein
VSKRPFVLLRISRAGTIRDERTLQQIGRRSTSRAHLCVMGVLLSGKPHTLFPEALYGRLLSELGHCIEVLGIEIMGIDVFGLASIGR